MSSSTTPATDSENGQQQDNNNNKETHTTTTAKEGKLNVAVDNNCHHDEEFNAEDVLDCSSPKPRSSTSAMCGGSIGTSSSSNCLVTPSSLNNQQQHQQQQQPIMMKFVRDEDTGKLIQAPIDEDEIQDYLDADSEDSDDDDNYGDDDNDKEYSDDEYDLGDELEKQFLDHVLSESMKTLDILSPVKHQPTKGGAVSSLDQQVVVDFMTGGAQDILEKQLLFDSELEELSEEEEENNSGELVMTDFNPGIVNKCIPLNEFERAIEESSSSILMEACMGENSNYYTLFQSALKRFYLDVKRFLLTQSYRKKQNNPSLQISSDEDEIKRKCYEVQPSLSYLDSVIYDHFVPKSSQKDDILSDSEMIRIAQKVIESKQERRRFCCGVEWTEECDKNVITTEDSNGRDGMEHFDDDSNDPEYPNASNKDELDKLKRFKTHGAHIRRIKIGQWSPTLNYDGQFLLKASPLLKKIYYKFFTYSPKYHIRPENANEKDHLQNFILEASVSKEALGDQVFRELDRFKVSHMLWMEIDYEDVIGVHLQKVSISKSIQDHPLGMLVLLLQKKPKFLTRRIACTDPQLNTLRERSDFTTDKQASLYNRHYIMGDYRELKRVLSVILHSEKSSGDGDGGRLSDLYSKGMENIFESEPVWNYDPSSDDEKSFILTSSNKDSIIDEDKLVRALPDEEGFLEEEDEEEEALYELEYDSDIGEFDFKNLGTTYQYNNSGSGNDGDDHVGGY